MIKNNDWKKTEEIETDLADMLRKLCMQWKQILICALVFAMLGGGYSILRNRGSTEAVDVETAEDIGLTGEEQQSVMSAVELQAEIKGLEEYLNGSVLMQTDPYHKHKIFMLYSIENAKRQDVQKITESYLSFLTNGGAADALKTSGSREWDIDKSYLTELISAYQKTYAYPYQIVADNGADSEMLSESLFYVDITGMDMQMAEQLASDIKSVLKTHYAKVKKIAGSHKLTLLSTEKTVWADSGLQTQQHDKKAQLTANRASLKAMTDAFSDGQMAVYKKEAAIIDEQMETDSDNKSEEAEKLTESVAANESRINIKYIVFGLFGGAFLYCFIFACWYLFRDTVKSEEEMKDLYTFPFYGGIPLKQKTGAAEGKTSDVLSGTHGQPDAQLLNRIRLACKKQGITKLCTASDFPLDTSERQCMENMAEQLESWGIHTVIAENAGRDTALWDTLTETGNILMVCRIGTTTHRMIDDAMRFYQENGISVLGAMAFD